MFLTFTFKWRKCFTAFHHWSQIWLIWFVLISHNVCLTCRYWCLFKLVLYLVVNGHLLQEKVVTTFSIDSSNGTTSKDRSIIWNQNKIDMVVLSKKLNTSKNLDSSAPCAIRGFTTCGNLGDIFLATTAPWKWRVKHAAKHLTTSNSLWPNTTQVHPIPVTYHNGCGKIFHTGHKYGLSGLY
jgi:hypothetical protein